MIDTLVSQISFITLADVWNKISQSVYQNLIYQDRWTWLLKGTLVTIEVAFFALILGSLLGAIACLMKISDNKVLSTIASGYISFIRGTPVLTQLLIIYFGIFAATDLPKVMVAIFAFGINSGAYMAEILRGGIMAVDAGQMEAGRSLGLSKWQTMVSIIFPQAIKNALPTIANEFIVLVKETSVSGYIAVRDITMTADSIRSLTYSAWIPLLAALVIYFILTSLLGKFFAYLERRMRASDKR